jgi:hypothetical protein
LHLFTPAGERAWAPGWEPYFPAGESADGGQVGTVFLTERPEGAVTWVVVERDDGRIRYARVTPGAWAGTVEVRLRPAPDGGTAAEVTYDLTAFDDAGRARLDELAEGYEAHLAEWERLIADATA